LVPRCQTLLRGFRCPRRWAGGQQLAVLSRDALERVERRAALVSCHRVNMGESEELVRLRAAGPADLALLRAWDEQPHVVASDPNDDWNWEVELGRNPDWREQLIAEV